MAKIDFDILEEGEILLKDLLEIPFEKIKKRRHHFKEEVQLERIHDRNKNKRNSNTKVRP